MFCLSLRSRALLALALVLLCCCVCLSCAAESLKDGITTVLTAGSPNRLLTSRYGWGFEGGGSVTASYHVLAVAANVGPGESTVAINSTLGLGCGGEGSAPSKENPLIAAALVVLRRSQWDTLSSSSRSARLGTSLCFVPSLAWYPLVSGVPATVTFNVTFTDQLVVVLTLCDDHITLATVRYKVDLANPGGNVYSIERFSLSAVNLAFTYVFFVFSVGWAAYLLRAYCVKRQPVHGLQLAVLMSVFLRSIESVMEALIGHDESFAAGLVAIFSEIIYLTSHFLLCCGWSMSPVQIPLRERNLAVAMITVHAVLSLITLICGDDDERCSAATQSAMLMMLRAERALFYLFCGFTLNALMEQLRKNLSSADTPKATAHFLRIRAIRFPYLISLPLPFFVYFLEASVLSWRGAFVVVIINNITSAYFYICVFAFFRPGLVM